MEGSGAVHVRLRLSTGALEPPWQEPEQGPQGPQAAQAPCAVGRGRERPSEVMHAEVLLPWQVPPEPSEPPGGSASVPCGCPHSLGQTCSVSQASDSWASPGQKPPHLGAGASHFR